MELVPSSTPLVRGDAHQRLDRLVAAMRQGGATTTAGALAASLGVSLRTLYRDLRRLRAHGVAIDARAGIGLRLLAAPARVVASDGANVEARVRVTSRGLRALRADPRLSLARDGEATLVRAPSREAIVLAALRAAGDVIVIAPEDLRQEVRARARAVARAHKN